MTPLLKGLAFVTLYTLGSIGVALAAVFLMDRKLERERREREAKRQREILAAQLAMTKHLEAEFQRLTAVENWKRSSRQ